MKQLPLAPPTCRRFLAVLTALGVAPRANAAQGFCATVCSASASPTDYWIYFFITMLTIILIRVIDKFMGPKAAPAAIPPAAAAPEAAEGCPRCGGSNPHCTWSPPENWQLVSEEEQASPAQGWRCNITTDDAETQTTPREMKDVRSQAPCTYTSVRGSNHPRFYPLPPHSHG